MGNLEFYVIGKDSGNKPVDWNEMNKHINLEYSYEEETTEGITVLDNYPAVNCTREGDFGINEETKKQYD